MKYLLDVNVVIAALISTHVHNARATIWMSGKQMVISPTSEKGFLRISTHKNAYNLPMSASRSTLAFFLNQQKVEFIADDLRALDSHPKTAYEVTDHYLADLAKKHGIKLATLDQAMKHPSIEIIS